MTPIIKSTQVPLTCEEAFDLFITQLDTWWPKASHAPLGPDAVLTVAPYKDGEIIETTHDGKSNLWGRIIAWHPGDFLAFTWFPESEEEDATIVAISFVPTPTGTRLDLTHGGYDILGETVDAVSTSYLRNWDMVLGSYCFAASKAEVMA